MNKYRLRIKNQDNFKTTTYDDFTNPINRPGIQDYKEKRPYLTPGKPHLSKYGQHKTRRRRPENSNSQPNRLLSNLTPQLNNDNSRYAEYEISESTLKENDYHLYNEDEDDEGFLDNFTPYIEEENGVKIPILPAPNPTNHM